MRSLARFVVFLALPALIGCDDGPTKVQSTTLVFDYASVVEPGSLSPAEAGSCAHHLLGSSWIQLVDGPEDQVQLFAVSAEPPTYRGTTVVWTTGVDYRVVIRDLECCTYAPDEPCWPVEGLQVNGIPVVRTVPLPTEIFPERVGLVFRVDRHGRVVP